MNDKVKVTTVRPLMFEGVPRTEFETTEQHRRELEARGYLVSPAAPAVAPAPAPAPAPEPEPEPADLTEAQKFVDGTIEDVKSRIDGADKESLQAALEAEQAKGEKLRKGVVDALTAALAA